MTTQSDLDARVARALEDVDSDAYWEEVRALRAMDSREVFDLAAGHILDPEGTAEQRQLGIDILAQLGSPERSFPEEVLALIAPILDGPLDEAEPYVLESALLALYHTRPPEEPVWVERARRWEAHPLEDVRLGVVYALMGFKDDAAVACLLRLTEDDDGDVRDWALFGLGTLSALDTPALLDAFAAHVEDPHDDARAEAIMALARRKDPRAKTAILREIEGNEPGSLVLKAAVSLGDLDLVAPLEALYRTSLEEDDINEGWMADLVKVLEVLKSGSLGDGDTEPYVL